MGFAVRPGGGASLCDRLMRSAEKGDWRFGMEGRKQERVTRRISLPQKNYDDVVKAAGVCCLAP